jgi:4-aminobutyrate aminotransferase-like enzyme
LTNIGIVLPDPGFLDAVRALTRKYSALLINDETHTFSAGPGGCTKAWGLDPDIVTIGKAIGGGFPLSALATTDEISRAKPWSNASGSSSSYGGNPLAAAAGAASLRILEDEGLVENARRVGAHMLAELETWVDRYPFVGCARGSGMFMALELVSDKRTKAPLPREVTQRFFMECVRRGLLTMSYSPHFRIQPPLTTDEATADNGLAILREVFDVALEAGWWRP